MKSVFHWDKVVFCSFYYVNQFGQRIDKLPGDYTIYGGRPVSDDIVLRHGITELDHAKWLGILDEWTACVTVGLFSNQHLTYKGSRAIAIWKEWNIKCYAKPARSKRRRHRAAKEGLLV